MRTVRPALVPTLYWLRPPSTKVCAWYVHVVLHCNCIIQRFFDGIPIQIELYALEDGTIPATFQVGVVLCSGIEAFDPR